MQTEPTLRLVTRRTDTNPNHHIWKNNGTWWIRITLRSTEGESIRHAYSLKTPDLDAARRKRDRILAAIQTKSGNIAA
jgi:hypothetical protein